MQQPVDLRGVLDPLVGIGRLVERDLPVVVKDARAREARRRATRPGFLRDAVALAVWGGALVGMISVASRFRRFD
jgi:hypothetical protein